MKCSTKRKFIPCKLLPACLKKVVQLYKNASKRIEDDKCRLFIMRFKLMLNLDTFHVIEKAVEVGADSSQYPNNWIFHTREKKPGKAFVDGKKIEFITAGGRVTKRKSEESNDGTDEEDNVAENTKLKKGTKAKGQVKKVPAKRKSEESDDAKRKSKESDEEENEDDGSGEDDKVQKKRLVASVASNKGDNSAAVVFEGDCLAVFETFLRTIPTCSADAQTYLRDTLGCWLFPVWPASFMAAVFY
ncbi:hypothetical protein TIFTF001_019142 [Ficus carica]|uniref:Formamidopyrimidine-DNA glycosylase-like C-terminal domain-containing protein n=1 Tax=Ficus carica TaxID=3494 RepID=A0AA88DCC3_FICCA|nr:hypothetical protein TIFTF001_019142 [Ficus carica]